MTSTATASPGARFKAINGQSKAHHVLAAGTDRSGTSGSAPAKGSTQTTSKADKKHERAYMACLNCRKYKVRCDRGPDPDRPQNGPCARCCREMRPCLLPDARRKRSKSDATENVSDDDEDGSPKSKNRKRSRTHSSATTAGNDSSATHRRASHANQTPRIEDDESEEAPLSPEAHHRVQSIKSIGAEGVLNEIAEVDKCLPQAKPAEQPSVPIRYKDLAGKDLPSMPPLNADEERVYRRGQSWADHSPVDKAEIEAAWSRFILVRNGTLWKIEEGIHFLECFYTHLAPLTPIVGIGVNHHEPMSHLQLLNEEPLLALTMITIAARFFEPDDPGKAPRPAKSMRAWKVQQKTWETLRDALADMVLGQEEAGADFVLPGEQHKSPHSSKLRNFDAIESLLLLTEWHSQELHFPDSKSLELMAGPGEDYQGTGRHSVSVKAVRAQSTRKPRWLESCLRSSRRCWALTCNALSIAIELGIWDTQAAAPRWTPSEQIRARRVGSLLYIFLQLANSRLPNASWKPPKPDLELLAPSSRWHHDGEHDPFTDLEIREPTFEEIEAETIWHWHYLVSTWREANEALFRDPASTKRRIEQWDYLKDVVEYDTRLARHSVELGPCRKLVPRNQRRIMNLELQYYRVHICSIALQAVWMRMTKDIPHHRKGEPVPAALFEKHIRPDQPAINRIIDASLSFLATVTTFANDGSMPYLPAHSYFRIIFVSYTLMKVFYLGLSSKDARQALILIKQVAEALQLHAPDDTHVSTHIGGILKTLAARVPPSLTNIRLDRGSSNGDTSNHNGLKDFANAQQTYVSDQQSAALGQFGMVQTHQGFDRRPSRPSVYPLPTQGHSRGQRQQDQYAREAYVRRLCQKTPSGTDDVLGPARQMGYGVSSPTLSALPPRSLYASAEEAANQFPIPQSSFWTPELSHGTFEMMPEDDNALPPLDEEQPSLVAMPWNETPDFGLNNGYAQHLWMHNDYLGHAPMSMMANAAEYGFGHSPTDQWHYGFQSPIPFPPPPGPAPQ